MRKVTYHILIGLPGSGKTHYVTNKVFLGHNGNDTVVTSVNLDDFMAPTIEESVEKMFCEHPNINSYVTGTYWTYENVEVYIDGVTSYTKKNFEKLIKAIMNCSASIVKKNTIYNIVVEQWQLDRETCLHNDRIRMTYGEREASAEATIKGTPYENAVLSDLKDVVERYKNIPNKIIKDISLVQHTVHKADAYDVIFASYEAYERENNTFVRKPIMKSDSWLLGGTWCNCWGDEITLEPEQQPQFENFITILEKVAPKITFLEYRKLETACVTTEDYTDSSDYYGGSEDRRRYVCDLIKLYNMLSEMGYIKDID